MAVTESFLNTYADSDALGLAAGNVAASAHCAEAPSRASEHTGDLAASPPARAGRPLSADDAATRTAA